jgi:hypothetical protein
MNEWMNKDHKEKYRVNKNILHINESIHILI